MYTNRYIDSPIVSKWEAIADRNTKTKHWSGG
eukprot:COSAG05_NODE_1122_length_5802_cov_3.431527_3_plen_32_part_00